MGAPMVGGGRCSPSSLNIAPASYEPPMMGGPASPLSRLVQDGYRGSRGANGVLPGQSAPMQGGSGFNAGIADQWSSNVQQTTAQHQQHHDPNYVAKYAKPTGYRVSNAPGGSSSLSLAWGGGEAPE